MQALYRQYSAEAEQLGVFGAPTFVLEGERFCGVPVWRNYDFATLDARRVM